MRSDRIYMCGKCKKTVTKIKWRRNLEEFTATPICIECYLKEKENNERKRQIQPS